MSSLLAAVCIFAFFFLKLFTATKSGLNVIYL